MLPKEAWRSSSAHTCGGERQCTRYYQLQETYGTCKLADYSAFALTNIVPASHPQRLVTTLVRRNIPVIHHATGAEGTDQMLVELLFTMGQRESNVFILNTHSRPWQAHRFSNILRRVGDLEGHYFPLLILGDFNNPQVAYGHGRHIAKGTCLWLDAQERLTLLTDLIQHTRRSTSTGTLPPTSPLFEILTVPFFRQTLGSIWVVFTTS